MRVGLLKQKPYQITKGFNDDELRLQNYEEWFSVRIKYLKVSTDGADKQLYTQYKRYVHAMRK